MKAANILICCIPRSMCRRSAGGRLSRIYRRRTMQRDECCRASGGDADGALVVAQRSDLRHRRPLSEPSGAQACGRLLALV
jgi:hypothetical protein